MRPIVRTLLALTGCLMLMRAGTVLAAVAPALKCEAAKLKAAGKDAACRANATAKMALGGAGDLARCDTQFTAAFGRAEAKGGCATSGDAPGVAARIDESIVATNGVLNPGGPFVDNGDGTVLDYSTGLQWEKKTDASDPLHYVDHLWEWAATLGTALPIPDGDVFTVFLATLNRSELITLGTSAAASAAFDIAPSRTVVRPPVGLPLGCFAGHCDWRLPTAAELLTIFDPSAPGGCPFPCPSLCVDPIFGDRFSNDAGAHFWTSDVVANVSNVVLVAFCDTQAGQLDGAHVTFAHFLSRARAVRTMSSIARTTTCMLTTCAAQGANCGSIGDGCGGTLNCGTCTAPQTCGGAGVPNQCGTTTTTTTTSSTTSTTLCPAGLTNCSGTCVNLTTDNNNCGSCGTVCPFNTPVCIGGVCTIP